MEKNILTKISSALLLIAIVSICIIWIFIRPRYESIIINDQLTSVQQTQKNTIDNLDRTIASWTDITRLLALQVAHHPKDGEIVLRSMLSLHSEILLIRIRASNSSDELASQNTSYPKLDLQIADSLWIRLKTDTAIHAAWISRPAASLQLFVTRMQFKIHNDLFNMWIVWDDRYLTGILSGMPQETSTGIYSSEFPVFQSGTSFEAVKTPGAIDTSIVSKNILKDNSVWHILKRPFHSIDLSMITAVPEKAIKMPVERFLIYSFSLVIGPMLIVFILGWIFSYRLKRYINKSGTDIKGTDRK